MDDVWYAAFGLLAILSVVNAVLLVAALRQIGVLHERLAASGIGELEPEPPSVVDEIPLDPVPGSERTEMFRAPVTVLTYVSPGCTSCAETPAMVRAAIDEGLASGIEIVLATDASPEEAQQFQVAHGSEDLGFVRNDHFVSHFGITASPYCVAVRQEDGRLRLLGAGIVNSRDHLNELLARARLTAASTTSGAGPDAEGGLSEAVVDGNGAGVPSRNSLPANLGENNA
ncbi:MAG: hypothetical protein M3Y75_05480 [Actinomycetota bacterium]|nr:hypothetical protein [Actinomycetota bacterium]